MAATTTLLATTNSTHGPTYGVSSRVKPYLVEQTIDFSDQNIDANGSTIECIDIPANCICMFAGIEVTTALTNTASDATVDLGPKSGDTDAWVDGFDIDGASAGTYATVLVATANPQVHDGADPLKLTFAGTAGTISAGVLRVFAVVMPVGGLDKATDVDRDALA
tara:strand:- start:466 stop:960 length:495 start_codon:yes stop_codon:yes gene_type:complete